MALAWRGCGMEWKQTCWWLRGGQRQTGRAERRVEGITQASDPRKAITSQTEQKGAQRLPQRAQERLCRGSPVLQGQAMPGTLDPSKSPAMGKTNDMPPEILLWVVLEGCMGLPGGPWPYGRFWSGQR